MRECASGGLEVDGGSMAGGWRFVECGLVVGFVVGVFRGGVTWFLSPLF